MKHITAKKNAAMFMIMLVMLLPVSFALSINEESIDVVVDGVNVQIKWTTDLDSVGSVGYGTSTSDLAEIPETAEPRKNHLVELLALQAGQKYYYKIESSDSEATVALPGWRSFITALSKPQNVVVEVAAQNSIKLKWDKTEGANKYNVYVNGILNATVTYFFAELKNLEPDTEYGIEVSAIDIYSTESIKSDKISVKTTQKPPEITFLQAVDITKTTAAIKWVTDVAANSTVRYGKYIDLGNVVADAGLVQEHSVKIIGLEQGALYFYKVMSGEVESQLLSFMTSSLEEPFAYSDVIAENITENSAVIKWRTNIEDKAAVHYGLDEELPFAASEPEEAAPKTEHEVKLEKLLSGATYYFKIKGESAESGVKTFITQGAEGVFLRVDDIPEYTSNIALNITGTLSPRSTLYIFLNDEKSAQVKEIINGSKFNVGVFLNPGARNDNITGKNVIDVLAWDKKGKKDEKVLYIVVDAVAPSLEISDIPSYTSLNTLNVSGITEPGAAVEFMLDEAAVKKAVADANGTFAEQISLKAQNQTLKVVARDIAGNENAITKEIVVDKTAPAITLLTDLKPATHFKILTLKGETEPNAKIYVTNYGEFTGCNDIRFTETFGKCTKFIGARHLVPGTMVSANIDPLGIAMGGTIEATADENGIFTVRVPMYMSAGLKVVGTNRVQILAQDKAGNVGEKTITIRYEPGCPDWTVEFFDIQSFPFNLYTKDFTDANLEASAFIPITYLGSGTPRLRSVTIYKDTSSVREGIMGNTGEVVEQEDGTEMVSLGSYKASVFDPNTRKVYIYLPLTVNRYSGSIKDLPDQINIYLKSSISYTVQGNEAPCDVYPVLSYSIQKPIDYSKWLTPEMINRTIQWLDQTLNVAKDIADIVKNAAIFTLLGCGAMVAYNYLSAGFEALPAAKGECSAAEQNLETVYWVCDRILCPNVPPDCLKQDWTQTNDGLTYRAVNPSTGDEYIFDYFAIKNNRLSNKEAASQIIQAEGKTIEISLSSLNSEAARQCSRDDQTLVRYRKITQEQGPFAGATKVVTPDFYCHGDLPAEVGKPDPKFLGCYSNLCPNFDNTKCFSVSGINPAGGLWASLRCACLPGIKSYLDHFIRIMEGAKKCLQQALIGEVRGGYCERLLAQFICDIFTELILKSLFGTSSSDTGILEQFDRGDSISNYKQNTARISERLKDRYGGIIKNRLGLSSDQLVNKFCIAAITLDWSVLENTLNQVIATFPVEPIIHVEADSRAYGFNPFVGRMNIGYNIYMGIVPGGYTETDMYLECDPSYPGAGLCRPGEKLTIPRGRRILNKNSPAVDENIVHVDKDAKWWYNKLVFVVKYELAGNIQQKIIEKPITHKGDLAFGCYVDVLSGIVCKTPQFVEEMGGAVQLYGIGAAGSYYSPQTQVYYPGNKIGFKVRLDNRYTGSNFFIRFDFPGARKQSIEYSIPSSTSTAEFGADQTYLLWVETIGMEELSATNPTARWNKVAGDYFRLGSAADSGAQSGTTTTTSASNGMLDISLSGAKQAFLNIKARAKRGEKTDVVMDFNCVVFGVGEYNKEKIGKEYSNYDVGIRKNGKLVKAQKTSAIGATLAGEMAVGETTSGAEQTSPGESQPLPSGVERITDDEVFFTRCIVPGDEFEIRTFGSAVNEKVFGTDIYEITEITATPVIKSELPGEPALTIKSGEQQITVALMPPQSIGSSAQTQRKAVVSLLRSTKDAEPSAQAVTGDTYLLYEGKPQTFEFNYILKESASGDEQPVVEIVEPVSEYIYDPNELLLGFTALDDRNDISEIKIKVNVGGTECIDIFTVDNDKLTQKQQEQGSRCGFEGPTDRSNDVLSNAVAPNFYEFRLAFAGHNVLKAENNIAHDVMITVKDSNDKEGRAQKRLTFKTATAAAPSNMICLGSGICSEWLPSSQTSTPITTQQGIILGEQGGISSSSTGGVVGLVGSTEQTQTTPAIS